MPNLPDPFPPEPPNPPGAVPFKTTSGSESPAASDAQQPWPEPTRKAAALAGFSPGESMAARLRESHRRLEIIETVEALKTQDGCSERKACAAAGIDPATYLRYRRAWTVGGAEALVPRTDRRGRNPATEPLTILELPEARQRLETLYLSTLGASSGPAARGRRTGKIATTLWLFGHEPICPESLAARLRDGFKPLPLVRHLKRITPELEARLRGPKHTQLYGLQSKRDQTFRLPDGRRAKNVAGALWEFDDMSVNQPFYWETQDSPTTASPMISRQGLYARDVRTGRWLGVELIARPREAYRAEDILRFFRRLFETFGKPRLIRLEKSVWAARSIKGVRIDTSLIVEENWASPEMPVEDRQKLQDGLAACGVKIQYCAHAHLKTIEQSFDALQTILATRTPEFTNIGRHAGEFEHGARQLRRVRAESHHPRKVGFAPMHELANRIEQSMTLLNSRPTPRLQNRAPDEIWDEEILQHPLRPLQPEDIAVFLPEVREITIRGGGIWPYTAGEQVEFRAPIFSELGDGYKVWARFDPMEPRLGAAIYNRESGARAFLGHGRGEMIAFASYVIPGPQATLTHEEAAGLPIMTIEQAYGPGMVDEGDSIRKKQDRRLRTEFRALPRPGQPSVKTGTMQDELGRVTRVEQQGPPCAPPQVPAVGPPPTPRRERVTTAPRRHLFDVPVTDEKSRGLLRRLAGITRRQAENPQAPVENHSAQEPQPTLP